MLSDNAERFATLGPVVTRLYGLSPSEARLVRLLVENKTPAEAAEARGVAESTIRNQIKAVLGKTGARSQVDLVRIVLLGVARFAG